MWRSQICPSFQPGQRKRDSTHASSYGQQKPGYRRVRLVCLCSTRSGIFRPLDRAVVRRPRNTAVVRTVTISALGAATPRSFSITERGRIPRSFSGRWRKSPRADATKNSRTRTACAPPRASIFRRLTPRLHRHGIAQTITTYFHNPGSGRFTHYHDLRALTVREAARFQSFDDDFILTGKLEQQMRHIGNAVPVLLSQAIAEHCALLLAEDGADAPQLPATQTTAQ